MNIHSPGSSPLSDISSQSSISDIEERHSARDAAASSHDYDRSNVIPLRRDSGKRPLSVESLERSKRIKFVDTLSCKDVEMMDLDSCLANLHEEIPKTFPRHFENLLGSNNTDVDNWLLPNHHRFMAALCQSVQEFVEGFCNRQGTDTVSTDHIDTLFQHALQALADLAKESSRSAPINLFLRNAYHVAYRNILQDPENKFTPLAAETEKIFDRVANKLKHLIPACDIEAGDMWKFCIDPQVVALLKKKNIKADAQLIGRFIFEGENQYLHNMARGWEFIVDAALEGRPLSFEFIVELNAILAGKTRKTDDEGGTGFTFEPESTSFTLLQSHTLSPQGEAMLKQTIASLRELGLDIMLEPLGECGGTKLKYYKLKVKVETEDDVEILEKWIKKCVQDHQDDAKILESEDEFAENDFGLAVKLNQAHVHPDCNVRTNHLLVNFLRLCRREMPFMFTEPNKIDGYTPAELREEMKASLAGNINIPPSPTPSPQQMNLLRQVKRDNGALARGPMRNVPVSPKFSQLGKSGYDNLDDSEIISLFPDGVWEAAQAKAKEPDLPKGVVLKAEAGKEPLHYLIHGVTPHPIRISAKTSVRSPLRARSLAIGLRMTVEAARADDDERIISTLPPGVWQAAQDEASKDVKRTGVFRIERNGYPCWRVKMGEETLKDVAIDLGRDSQQAKALAIALRMAAEMEKEDEYAGIIERLPPGLWEKAQARANKDGLPTGVQLITDTIAGGYSASKYGREGSKVRFSVNDKYDDNAVKALAIAVRWDSEPDEYAEIIKALPEGILEKARAMVADDKNALIPGVIAVKSKSGVQLDPAAYKTRVVESGSRREHKYTFTENHRYDNDAVHAIALAVKMADDEKKTAARAAKEKGKAKKK